MNESELGIQEYLFQDNPGFDGVIKERFSDFNVYEIDNYGKIVKLENQSFPEETIAAEPNVAFTELSEEEKAVVSEFLFSRIKLFNKDPESENIEIDVTDFDKNNRKLVHQVLKKFPKIDSNTIDKDGKKFIIAKAKSSGKSNKQNWPRDRPKYLHFTLYKENSETYEAISLLAKRCRTDEKYFGFAGTKDRRGRTTQRVSVSMVSAKQMLGAARGIQKVDVGNFSYQTKEIRLGDLTGNRFELAIRNMNADNDMLRPVLESFSQFGFINYFGTQRFGTTGVPTHHIGREIICSNYSAVIDLILKPRDHENIDALRDARNIWADSGDAEKALEILRKGRKDRTVEGKLLYGLSKRHKNDIVGALDAIPRQQRLLYCHAYQSYLWNKVVSKRIRTHGLKVLKGDLVQKKDVDDKMVGDQPSKEEFIEHVENPEEYEIHEVLVPIPGCKVKFPDNEVRNWFEELLMEENLSIDSFSNTVKDYNLPGDYRNMLVKPKDVSWNLVKYDELKEDLIMSDREKMLNPSKGLSPSKETNREHPYKALVISFSLPSSCYATMALREILRVETDKKSLMRATENQSKLSETLDESKNLKRGSNCNHESEPNLKSQKVLE